MKKIIFLILPVIFGVVFKLKIKRFDIMKTNVHYLVCLFAIIFIACSENSVKEVELSITTSSIGNSSYSTVIAGGVVQYGTTNTPTTIGVCYAKTHNPAITDSVSKCNIVKGVYSTTIKNLETGVTYFARAFATKSSGETIYGSEVSFTTKAIQVDYLKFYYSLDSWNGDYNDSLVVCVESGLYTIYGHGFANAAMKLKMVARNNKNDFFYPKVEIQSDSLLNFKIPDDLLGSNPYVVNKKHYLLINNVPFINSRGTAKSRNDKLYDASKDTAFFQIDNKDIHIDMIKLWPASINHSTCNYYDIHGEFGGYNFYGTDPKRSSYHGVLNRPLKQTLFAKVNGVVSTYSIVNSGNMINGTNCGDVTEIYVIRDHYIYYHDSVLIRIITNFPYNEQVTFQVENTMADGTIFRSNEYTFTNPQTSVPCSL